MLLLRRSDNDRNGVAEFHDVIDGYFDVIGPGGLEFDLAENRNVGGMEGDVLESELDFAFPQDSDLVGSDEADGFGELAKPGGPAIEQAEFERNHGQLGHTKKVDDTDQYEITGDFLAYFLAEQRALKIGQDAGWIHE